MEQKKYKHWFADLIGISANKKIILTEEASEQELFHMSEMELFKLCEYHEVDAGVILESRLNFQQEKDEVQLVTYHDKHFPRKLKYINQPPYAIYYKGQLPKDEVSVAIVGARSCTQYGRAMADKLARELANRDVSVISGMAYGIDCAGHAGALDAGGRTYAVLGCGVDICYPPEAENIYQNIIQSQGGIISEYPAGTNPLPKFFPARNRIISGLADIVVVVEAKLRSGSLITADFAMDQGKDVYALPGRITDPNSQGCNRLIYQGAAILENIEQFLEDTNLNVKSKKSSQKENNFSLEKEELLLYSVLNFVPKYLDIIIEETGLQTAQVFAIMKALKKKNLVKEIYKNYFCRTK